MHHQVGGRLYSSEAAVAALSLLCAGVLVGSTCLLQPENARVTKNTLWRRRLVVVTPRAYPASQFG